MKVFQSDGGTKFLNGHIKSLYAKNTIHHRILCPYMPEQIGVLSANTDIILKPTYPCSSMQMLQPHFGLMPLHQLYTLLTGCLQLF